MAHQNISRATFGDLGDLIGALSREPRDFVVAVIRAGVDAVDAQKAFLPPSSGHSTAVELVSEPQTRVFTIKELKCDGGSHTIQQDSPGMDGIVEVTDIYEFHWTGHSCEVNHAMSVLGAGDLEKPAVIVHPGVVQRISLEGIRDAFLDVVEAFDYDSAQKHVFGPTCNWCAHSSVIFAEI